MNGGLASLRFDCSRNALITRLVLFVFAYYLFLISLSLKTVTLPDFSVALDQCFLFIIITFAFIGGGANKLNLPFLTRQGGLLTYSKFANGVNNRGPSIDSKLGMFLLYFLPALIGVYMLFSTTENLPSSFLQLLENRVSLTAVLIIVHFGKRCFECLFIHRYSGYLPITLKQHLNKHLVVVPVPASPETSSIFCLNTF